MRALVRDRNLCPPNPPPPPPPPRRTNSIEAFLCSPSLAAESLNPMCGKGCRILQGLLITLINVAAAEAVEVVLHVSAVAAAV